MEIDKAGRGREKPTQEGPEMEKLSLTGRHQGWEIHRETQTSSKDKLWQR